MSLATLEAQDVAPKRGNGHAKRKMSRYMITGAGGQLGSELHRIFERSAQSLPKARESLDITNVKQIAEWFPTLRPDVVINCAAFTRVMESEQEREKCWMVNAFAVDNLAKVCAANDIPLIHISTDHVFGQDSRRRVPYTEIDVVGPTGVYGHSKASGEQAILRQAVENPDFKYWIIRTAGLFERPWRDYWNFPSRLLALANKRRGAVLPVVNDVWTSPTYVPHLAEALAWLVENLQFLETGIYHMSSKGCGTWFQFAELVQRLTKGAFQVTPTTKEAWYVSQKVNPQLIPSYPVLDGSKYLDYLGGPPMPTWEEGVSEWCSAYRKQHA